MTEFESARRIIEQITDTEMPEPLPPEVEAWVLIFEYPGWQEEDGRSSYGYPLPRQEALERLSQDELMEWVKRAAEIVVDTDIDAQDEQVDHSWHVDCSHWLNYVCGLVCPLLNVSSIWDNRDIRKHADRYCLKKYREHYFSPDAWEHESPEDVQWESEGF